MKRLCALMLMTVLMGGLARPDKQLEAAVTFLVHNRELCAAVAASGSSISDAAVVAGRRALARETLAIAEALLDQVPDGSEAKRLGTDVLGLQRRLCGGAEPQGDPEAVRRQHEETSSELSRVMPVSAARRDEILLRFLDRREGAVMTAVAQVRSRPAASQDSVKKISDPPPGDARRTCPAGQAGENTPPSEVVAADVAVASNGADDGSEVSPGQVWDPSPDELGQRRMLASRAFRERLHAWTPTYERQVRPLVAARVRLARDLRRQSLEQLRPLCSGFVEAVAAIDYSVVLQAPEVVLREDLHRMLAGYAAAGRLCAAGRWALAWSEINRADRRWSRVVTRLSRLEKGGSRR
ncbi:MAG: hypothetical protein OEM62_06990 [Acidobacteriota bacterium]|nr:hypothetical protein [Acidobacteriota bacterium]